MARPVLLITMAPPREGAAPSSSPVDQWMKRLQEAHRLVDEVAGQAKRVAERESVTPSLPRELQRRNPEIQHVPYMHMALPPVAIYNSTPAFTSSMDAATLKARASARMRVMLTVVGWWNSDRRMP